MPEDHDRFADELDRFVTGHPPGNASDLAAFAGEVQGIGAERIDDEQRDRIRRRLMQHATSFPNPTTGGAGPLSQPTLTDPAMMNPWERRRPTAAATPSGWRGHLVKAQTAIAIMTTVALLIVGGAWYTNQQGGDDPGPTTTRYAAAPTEDVSSQQNLGMQESTPASDVATPEAATLRSTPLLELLSVLPAPLALAEGGTLPGWTYADLDQRFEDLGLTDEQLAEDPTLPLATNAYAPLAHTTSLFDHAADDEFVEAIGFNPLTVDQVLVTGRAPDVLTLLRGEWDEDMLTTAWAAAGYTEYAALDGVTIWSLDSQGMVDPQHPIQARMFQQLNNVAILDGGILAYAGYSTTIEMVIETQTGDMASALDDPWLEPLFAQVSGETVSSIGITQAGSTLYDLGEIAANPNISPGDRERIEEPLRASRETVGPMPEYRGVVFAVEGDPEAGGEIVVRLRAFSDDQAEQIVRVFEWRWQNFTSPQYQQTFDSIMPLVDASAAGDLVTLRFDSQGIPQMWLQIVQGEGLIAFAVDVGLPVGTPEASPVATPASTGIDSSPTATPGATTETSSPLAEMLSVLPADMIGIGFGTLDGWLYADIEQRFADIGLTDAELAEDPMLPLAMQAYVPLASTTSLFDFATDQEFVEAIGFNPVTVDQVLVAGEVPHTVTLLRGDWDAESLTAAWEAAGYTQHETDSGVTIWSLDPEGMVDPQHPIQARMFQQMNNVAILDGGILAYAGTLDAVEQVVQAQAGEIPVASQDVDMAGLITALPDGMVSSIGYDMPGSLLYNRDDIQQNPNIAPEDKETIEEPFAASLEAVGPMPEYRGAVFALAGGGEDDAEAVAILGAESEEDAAQIVHVIEWRWQNFLSQRYQRPLESLMPLIDARTNGTTVILRFDTQGVPEMWLNLLNSGDLAAFAVDTDAPVGTPEASPVAAQAIPEEDAYWWTWPSGGECRPEAIPEDTLEPADYPERAYLPLGTPDREDAEDAAHVARTAMACQVHYSTPPFSSSRYREEQLSIGEDFYDYGQMLLEQNENGRAIAEAFPISDPTEFGRLTDDEPSQATPPPFEFGRLSQPMYEPYTAVFIPSQAVELADGRIAIPESLLGMVEDADLAYRGDPATWVRHYSLLVVLSDASGTWHIDEILPFCIGPDCNLFWEQNEEIAHRVLAGATPEAPMETPVATPEAIVPVDDRIWLACPEYTGPYTYASREGVTSDVSLSGALDPRSTGDPAEPPSIPCDYPGPEPPENGNPIPLD